MHENKKRGGNDAPLKVLDVGGKNWNGLFDFFDNGCWERHGLDIQPGDGVNIVPADAYNWVEIGDCCYDLAISANSFQHIDYFWETIREMARVTVPGGLIYIIAPSNRYDGKYPHANYSFNKHGMVAMATWADLEIIDCSVAGIPNVEASNDWDDPLDDAVLIARKKDEYAPCIPDFKLSIARRFQKSY